MSTFVGRVNDHPASYPLLITRGVHAPDGGALDDFNVFCWIDEGVPGNFQILPVSDIDAGIQDGNRLNVHDFGRQAANFPGVSGGNNFQF
ncbi:MAG: hypothetical protein IH878_16500 [Gemmatimonadetes bacterium]|nr:hypothetical protein [Gemmatimonadota bacterium]